MDIGLLLRDNLIPFLQGKSVPLQLLGISDGTKFYRNGDNLWLTKVTISDGSRKIENAYIQTVLIDEIIKLKNFPIIEMKFRKRIEEFVQQYSIEIQLYINDDTGRMTQKVGQPKLLTLLELKTFMKKNEEMIEEQNNFPNYQTFQIALNNIAFKDREICRDIKDESENEEDKEETERNAIKRQKLSLNLKKIKKIIEKRFTTSIDQVFQMKTNEKVKALIMKITMSFQTQEGTFFYGMDNTSEIKVFIPKTIFQRFQQTFRINNIVQFSNLKVDIRKYRSQRQDRFEKILKWESYTSFTIKQQNLYPFDLEEKNAINVRQLKQCREECTLICFILKIGKEEVIKKGGNQLKLRKLSVFDLETNNTQEIKFWNSRIEFCFFSSVYLFKNIQISKFKGTIQFSTNPTFSYKAINSEIPSEEYLNRHVDRMQKLQNLQPAQFQSTLKKIPFYGVSQVKCQISKIFTDMPELQTFEVCEICYRKSKRGQNCKKSGNFCVLKQYYEIKMKLQEYNESLLVEAYGNAAKQLIKKGNRQRSINPQDYNQEKVKKKKSIRQNIEGCRIKGSIFPYKEKYNEIQRVIYILYEIEFL